jgi:hypothetical protein
MDAAAIVQDDDDGPKRTGGGFMRNIIIDPTTSSWLWVWNFFVVILLFRGYVHDPYHIAFILSSKNSTMPEMLDRTNEMNFTLVIDVFLTIDILIHFITAYEVDEGIETEFLMICWHYLRGSMIFDLLATIPALFLDGNKHYFFFKLLRIIHVRRVFSSISEAIKAILNRAGFDKASVEKMSYIMDLFILSFSVIHILSCVWIYFGNVVEGSWMQICPEPPSSKCSTGMYVNRYNDTEVYITAMYWVITTLTTVGYGDYKGYTPKEYLIQMVVEFLGIGIFSYLMGSISSLVGSEQNLQDILDERVEQIENWLRKLEKARTKSFSKQLYDCIKEFTRKSYQYDFIAVTQSEFFHQLKPRVRHKLVNSLFSNFTVHFFYMFNDTEFEAGCEFTSNFLSSLYSSLYLPENEIVGYGDRFEELVMIQEGIISLQVSKVDKEDMNACYEFFILPTYSYCGDY